MRRTLALTTSSPTSPDRTAAASLAPHGPSGPGMARSSPATAVSTVLRAACQSDRATPSKPHSSLRMRPSSGPFSVIVMPLTLLYPLPLKIAVDNVLNSKPLPPFLLHMVPSSGSTNPIRKMILLNADTAITARHPAEPCRPNTTPPPASMRPERRYRSHPHSTHPPTAERHWAPAAKVSATMSPPRQCTRPLPRKGV